MELQLFTTSPSARGLRFVHIRELTKLLTAELQVFVAKCKQILCSLLPYLICCS